MDSEDRHQLRRSLRLRTKRQRRYIEAEWGDFMPSPIRIVNRQLVPDVPTWHTTRPRSRGVHNEARANNSRTYMNQQIGARVPTRPRSSPGRRIEAPTTLIPSMPDEQARSDPGVDLHFEESHHTSYVPRSRPIRAAARIGLIDVPQRYGDVASFHAAGTGPSALSSFRRLASQPSSDPQILGTEELESGDVAEPYDPAEAGREEDEYSVDIDDSFREEGSASNRFPNGPGETNFVRFPPRFPESQNSNDQRHDPIFRLRELPSQAFRHHDPQFHGQGDIKPSRSLRCGFRFSVDDEDVVFGGLGLQEDFKPRTMDVVISDRNLFMRDTRGVVKPNSYVRFKTDGLTLEDRIGNMILRIGDLICDSSGRSKLVFTAFMELFEQTGPREWEKTSSRMLGIQKIDFLLPWPWPVLVDYYTVLGKPDTPLTRYAHMESCVLLRRKSDGEHDHDCQKLDWYDSANMDHMDLRAGDLLVRFGVQNLERDPSMPDAAEIFACAELCYYDGQGWIFEGREECWMRGHDDVGFDLNWVPGQILGLTQFSHYA